MPRPCQEYDSLRQGLRPLLCAASKPQLNNLSLFVFGLIAAMNVQLPKIALYLPIPGTLRNAQQRLERFLQNTAVAATDWYKPIARRLLGFAAWTEIELILDATDLGDRLPMLFVALSYKGRALPILWRMLPAGGCSPFTEQQVLLKAVADLIPSGARVVLLADREYGSADLICLCLRHGWHFVIRLKCNRWCRLRCGRAFQLREIPLRAGTIWFEEGITLDDLPGVRLSLSCGWSQEHPDDEPWYLLSDLPAGKEILARYVRRFWIEEMFRDFKEQGFRLEKTRMSDPERVSRLVLCVCIAYVWMVRLGVQVAGTRLQRQVDRRKKRQLSLFQMGIRYLKRMLTLRQHTEEMFCLQI
jgi:hypothetical protein